LNQKASHTSVSNMSGEMGKKLPSFWIPSLIFIEKKHKSFI
jgi:hypothetical protein